MSEPDLHFVVEGQAASKSNTRRKFRNQKTGLDFFAKSERAEVFKDVFLGQCPKFYPLLDGDLFAYLRLYYASRRPDLDETLLLDLMQGCVYNNDRQVKGRLTLWGLAPGRPRVEVTLWRMARFGSA